MRILVTGGTGGLGKPLCLRLAKKHEVTSFSSNTNKDMEVAGIKQLVGDITDPADCEKAVGFRPDVVYHLAASLDETDQNLWKVNVEGTKNVIEAARSAGVKRLIFTSPIGILGPSAGAPITEDAPYHPRTPYERSKAEAERLVIESGLPYTVLRLTIVIGPQYSWWKQVFEAARKRYPVIGDGSNYWHTVHTDDAVDALELALKPAAANRVYNIASADPRTYLETYRLMCCALGIGMPHKHAPKMFVNLFCLLHEAKCKLLHQRPNVTRMRASVLRLTENRLVSIERARKELGFAPSLTTEEAVRRTAKALGI